MGIMGRKQKQLAEEQFKKQETLIENQNKTIALQEEANRCLMANNQKLVENGQKLVGCSANIEILNENIEALIQAFREFEPIVVNNQVTPEHAPMPPEEIETQGGGNE